MNRTQFWILNGLAGVLVAVLLLKIGLTIDLAEKQVALARAQTQVAQAQRAEVLLREISVRLAQASAREPQLTDLLKMHSIRVSPASPSSNLP